MRFEVRVESAGYGQTLDEGEQLEGMVGEMASELEAKVFVDEERGMLLTIMQCEAEGAHDACSDALEAWRAAWDEAFPDEVDPVLAFAVTVKESDVDGEGEDEDEDGEDVG